MCSIEGDTKVLKIVSSSAYTHQVSYGQLCGTLKHSTCMGTLTGIACGFKVTILPMVTTYQSTCTDTLKLPYSFSILHAVSVQLPSSYM